MRVLMVEPGKPPYETELKDGLKSMQKAVGGYIEGCYPFEDPVALICNENGKVDGLPLNRARRSCKQHCFSAFPWVAYRKSYLYRTQGQEYCPP